MFKRWKRKPEADDQVRAEKAQNAVDFGMYNSFAFSQSQRNPRIESDFSGTTNQRLAALHILSQTWDDE